ncbi:MAG TPA: hypothetical protein VJ877_09075, partial [Bacteroidales bacterium]|nr:hypothetical protein [Bacteroidales bacterium]
PDKQASLWSMITGGSVTFLLIVSGMELPMELDPIIFGITASVIIYALISTINQRGITNQ